MSERPDPWRRLSGAVVGIYLLFWMGRLTLLRVDLELHADLVAATDRAIGRALLAVATVAIVHHLVTGVRPALSGWDVFDAIGERWWLAERVLVPALALPAAALVMAPWVEARW